MLFFLAIIKLVFIFQLNHVLSFGFLQRKRIIREWSMTQLRSAHENVRSRNFKVLIDSCIQRIDSQFSIRMHPGFALSLGCNNWKASGYTGTMIGMSSKPHIKWMSSNHYMNTEKMVESWDFLAIMDSTIDVPYLRISLQQRPNSSLFLFTDLVPRHDLVAFSFSPYTSLFLFSSPCHKPPKCVLSMF